MGDQPAIVVDNLHKSFRLPHEQHTSLKQTVLNWHRRSYETLEVLDGISLRIDQGEFFGILGRNGSGKSTLLKTIAGIYHPNQGQIAVNGQLTPFIELGVGFDQELTGRDNIFLNGAILGLSREEIDDVYHKIVEFSELEKFMDQKLKNYSSGMLVRLAFSIAVQAHTDILLIDEVLAVGDEAFQQKCLSKFDEYKRKNRTVVIVTHDMEIIRRYCDRAVVIEKGDIIATGSAENAATVYEQVNKGLVDKSTAQENQNTSNLGQATIANGTRYQPGEEILLKLNWEKLTGVENIGVAIFKESGEYVFGANTILDDVKLSSSQATYNCKLDIGPGKYFFKIGFFKATDKETVEFIEEGPRFVVDSPEDLSWQGITYLEHNWGT